MESNDKLNEIDIKSRTCYYFGDLIKIDDFDFNDILIDEKSHENILVFIISYKHLLNLCVLNSIKYDGTRYLVLFGSEKYDSIYYRIRYIICVKSGVTYVDFS